MRFSIDIGGTFTDLVIEDDDGRLWLEKSPTTPDDPVYGILNVLEAAARAMGLSRRAMLARGEILIHATTRALNAVLTNSTARTAFLTTKGHPDILLLREGGRERFNYVQPYPDPYVPRSLTFEVPERIGSRGAVVLPLDEEGTIEIIRRLAKKNVEAVAVCLLWSIVNPVHELRLGELLDQYLPGVPYTLSHILNPAMREYRRASSAAIDASLKPVMTDYLRSLRVRLCDAGFAGRLLIVTSNGGVLDSDAVAEAPIHSIKSGPAMAPVAGRYYGQLDAGADSIVVADTGGTSYDVSLVRHGKIPWTRETWLGPEFTGHMTGFPSIDVQSIGAGGGSIAWIDEGGLLHVGPQSAGAAPGPACYGRGGTRPTVTDACLVLGYLDPDYFLGGAMHLNVEMADKVLDEHIGQRLEMNAHDAAAAIMQVMTENMVQLIEEIALNQGVDPRNAVLVGGGGAAGLNSVAIARRLGCSQLIIPETGAALSAFGALLTDLTADYAATFMTSSLRFDFAGVAAVLARLQEQCRAFIAGPGAGALESRIELSGEVRYPSEIWELEVPLRKTIFDSTDDVERLRQDFHAAHLEVFGTSDPGAPVEVIGWRGRVSCRLHSGNLGWLRRAASIPAQDGMRQAYFPKVGLVNTIVRHFDALTPGERLLGPAIIESPVTTVVINPGASVEHMPSGSLSIRPWADGGRG
jgi:N-methylhydantoinase A